MAEAQRIAEYNERRYSMAIRAIPLWEGRTLFRSHLGRIRTWAHTHNVTDANQLKIGLFSSIHGDPLELVQEFDIDSPNFEALVTYKDYAQALKDIFHPRAEAGQEEYIEYMVLEDAEHDINLCIRPFPSRRASDHDDYELEEKPFYQVCDNWSNGSQVEIW